MAELLTVVIDIGLGLLAYRLAYENRAEITKLKERLEKVEEYVANNPR